VIEVVIADDDPRVRADFRTILELEDDLRVVAVEPDGAAAVEACRRLRPDVAVLDVRMPVLDGIEATQRLRSDPGARTKVLVVTTFDLDDYVLGAVRAGASGFLLKDQAPDVLASAVRTVARGEAIVAPRATARLLRELLPAAGFDPSGVLTDREVEIARLVALGLSNEDAAAAAGISRATVKTHVSNILLKLGCTSRLQIAVWAYEHGIVRIGDGRQILHSDD
jgi:DNA-binding NarL/FixJ family response regulator